MHVTLQRYISATLTPICDNGLHEGKSPETANAQWPEACQVDTQAVSQLDQLDSPDLEWLVSALLRRLADEDLDVVATVLSSKVVIQVPAAALFEAVAQTMARAWEPLLRKDQSVSGGKAQAVLKNVSHWPDSSCWSTCCLINVQLPHLTYRAFVVHRAAFTGVCQW